MIRPPFTPAMRTRAYRDFHAKLYLTTRVDAFTFACWIRDNREWLRDYFCHSGEPHEHREVENCQGIWLRLQFKAHMAVTR